MDSSDDLGLHVMIDLSARYVLAFLKASRDHFFQFTGRGGKCKRIQIKVIIGVDRLPKIFRKETAELINKENRFKIRDKLLLKEVIRLLILNGY